MAQFAVICVHECMSPCMYLAPFTDHTIFVVESWVLTIASVMKGQLFQPLFKIRTGMCFPHFSGQGFGERDKAKMVIKCLNPFHRRVMRLNEDQ